MNGFESAGRRGRNSLHDLASLIRRAIVYSDHFVIVVFEGKQARERSPDVGGFIAGGNDHSDPRMLCRPYVPLRAAKETVLSLILRQLIRVSLRTVTQPPRYKTIEIDHQMTLPPLL